MSRHLPAVQLDNIPRQMIGKGNMASWAFLGSGTGKEVGVCFWLVDPALPRFTVVFKRVEDRENWASYSPMLNTMRTRHGVSSSLVYYDTERNQVVRPDEPGTAPQGDRHQPGPPGGEFGEGSSSYECL